MSHQFPVWVHLRWWWCSVQLLSNQPHRSVYGEDRPCTESSVVSIFISASSAWPIHETRLQPDSKWSLWFIPPDVHLVCIWMPGEVPCLHERKRHNCILLLLPTDQIKFKVPQQTGEESWCVCVSLSISVYVYVCVCVHCLVNTPTYHSLPWQTHPHTTYMSLPW